MTLAVAQAADIVVGLHGSNMANALFMRPGSALVGEPAKLHAGTSLQFSALDLQHLQLLEQGRCKWCRRCAQVAGNDCVWLQFMPSYAELFHPDWNKQFMRHWLELDPKSQVCCLPAACECQPACWPAGLYSHFLRFARIPADGNRAILAWLLPT